MSNQVENSSFAGTEERTPVITKSDLTKCGVRWFMSVLMYNYETQLAPSVVFAEKHALRKIYKDDESYRKSLANSFRYFNATPPVAGLLLGAGLAMEDAKGTEALDAVNDLKVGLMGSLSGVGDSLIWVLIPTIMGSIAAYMAHGGNPAGIILWLPVAILSIGVLKVYSWHIGYRFGAALITTLADKISAFTEAASILGLTVVGALIPAVVVIKTGITFTMGDVSLGLQEGVLDAILLGMLPVAATAIVYALLKKNVSMTWIILGIVVLSCLGAATGVLTV